MKTHVYANGHEIACKAANTDGVSASAFPDPCHTPPGVVVPYPNTAYAKDLTHGTQTVFICGTEVALEDESYFATSTGNEPATDALKKGVASEVIKGKAYFQSWSMNVKFEGLGVARDIDLMGHNHGSMPSNTPVFPYVSRSWKGHECKDEEARIERACQPESKDSENREELRKKSKLSSLLHQGRGAGRRDKKGWHWTDDHCDGLHVRLGLPEEAMEYAKKMEEAFKSLPKELEVLSAMEGQLKDMAMHATGTAAAKVGAKFALKQVAGSSLPVAGNAVMGVWSVVDVAMAAGDVKEIKAVATESLEQLRVLKSKLGELQQISKQFENFSKLSKPDQLKKAQELATDGQDALATLNACTRARKCNLVPYKADGAGNPFGTRGRSKVESADHGGCCGGQTGHHLIPEASIKDSCANYDHDVAPTVCVEGTSQNFGSHRRIHQALGSEHASLAKKGRVAADGSMSMTDALNAAVQSHAEAFPLSRCSKACIRAQLESYYRACSDARPKMLNDQGKPTLPRNDTNK